MSYFRKLDYPQNKPPVPDSYFCGWIIGDIHWRGAAIWDGKKFEKEKEPDLKGMQPTYWLAPFAGFTGANRHVRYSQQELEDLNFLSVGDGERL